MRAPCSACWRGVPALPERLEAYLDAVAASIGWRRARPFVLRELRTHLLEQKEDFLASGMTEEAAEEAAVREMGDAAQVGAALNDIHRPREQRLLLGAVVVLAVLGVFLRFALTWGWETEMPHPLKTPLALAVGLAALVGGYFLDYRLLERYARQVFLTALALGIVSLHLSPKVNHVAWWARNLVLLYPPVYAAWVAHCGKGWKGQMEAALGIIPLCIVAMAAPSMLGLAVLIVTWFAVEVAAADADWFGVGRKEGLSAIFGSGAAVMAQVLNCLIRGSERLAVALHPEKDPLGSGYLAMTVRNMLSGAQWLGRGSTGTVYGDLPYERIVPEWGGDLLLTTVIHKLGWLPFFLLAGAVLSLAAVITVKALRLRNGFGRLLALSAGLTLGVQTVMAIAMNLGYVFCSCPMPLLSGNLHTIVTLALLGLALSAFRQEALPEESPRAAASAPAVQAQPAGPVS